ncbi:MAG: outer membrane lipoprotein carrier protein LolA [Rhodobacteraceae bacterium]|nr:outer membrane lipoprotein carrier protein LolA [Paracoccaceae bacterium]MCB1366257.1 outer membrane lipoprotein carrier protein LolA [Paracoccaceae bacterium]
MSKSAFLLSAMLSLPLAATAAERIPLADLSAFLNELTTAKGSFTQINPDGTISTGTLYIHRPGRMRFEYDPPDPALVMAGGGTVAIFDRKSNEPPQQFPLKETPLWVILERNVDLGRADMITAHVADDVATTITAQDPENPDLGHIELRFTAEPVELRQWIITDQGGAATTVILGDMERGLDLGASLFSVPIELRKLRETR